MPLDERGAGGAAADCFKAKRASSCEKINGVFTGNRRAKQVEHGLADALFHRPRAGIDDVRQLAATQSATNDPRRRGRFRQWIDRTAMSRLSRSLRTHKNFFRKDHGNSASVHGTRTGDLS